VSNAIIEMQWQTLMAGRDVHVPFFKNRRLCTPADPADFLNGATSVRHAMPLATMAVVGIMSVLMATRTQLWR